MSTTERGEEMQVSMETLKIGAKLTGAEKFGGKLQFEEAASSFQDNSTLTKQPRLPRDKNFLKPKTREAHRRRTEELLLNGKTLHSQGIRPRQPARELYRPPVMTEAMLNPAAKEFAPLAASRSFELGSKVTPDYNGPQIGPQDNIVLNRTGLTITVPGGRHAGLTKSRSVTSQISLDRSSEVGRSGQLDLNVFSFPLEVINTLSRALEDPNRVPSRSLMELVKTVLNRVISRGMNTVQGVQSSESHQKVPEQAAKLCISIIEREQRETFLESLINTCQELYHDRETMLRHDVLKWTSYLVFLNEMYGMLKRKQLHLLTKYEGVAPKLVLLSLLAECCTATLTSSLQSTQEVETLFVVLTQIGKDLETETPGRMSLLVTCLREAFLNNHINPQIGKTLLQLIELQAAGWNLPAQAVMYYYPGSST